MATGVNSRHMLICRLSHLSADCMRCAVAVFSSRLHVRQMAFVAKTESDLMAVRLTFLFFFALAANVYFYPSSSPPPLPLSPVLITYHAFCQVTIRTATPTVLQCIIKSKFEISLESFSALHYNYSLSFTVHWCSSRSTVLKRLPSLLLLLFMSTHLSSG